MKTSLQKNPVNQKMPMPIGSESIDAQSVSAKESGQSKGVNWSGCSNRQNGQGRRTVYMSQRYDILRMGGRYAVF
jgi:hypothetical protein